MYKDQYEKNKEFFDEVIALLEKGPTQQIRMALSIWSMSAEFKRAYKQRGGTDPDYRDLAREAGLDAGPVYDIMEARPAVVFIDIDDIKALGKVLGLQVETGTENINGT